MANNNMDDNKAGQGTVISTEGGQGGTALVVVKGTPENCWPSVGIAINISGTEKGGQTPTEKGVEWLIITHDCGDSFFWVGPVTS